MQHTAHLMQERTKEQGPQTYGDQTQNKIPPEARDVVVKEADNDLNQSFSYLTSQLYNIACEAHLRAGATRPSNNNQSQPETNIHQIKTREAHNSLCLQHQLFQRNASCLIPDKRTNLVQTLLNVPSKAHKKSEQTSRKQIRTEDTINPKSKPLKKVVILELLSDKCLVCNVLAIGLAANGWPDRHPDPCRERKTRLWRGRMPAEPA
jgi:hypothetical protein